MVVAQDVRACGESTCCGARMSEDEVGEHSDRGEQKKAWTRWPQSVVEVEARRFMVIDVKGARERHGERGMHRGAKVKGVEG